MWKYLNQAQLVDGELWAVLKALYDTAADIFLLILETFQLFVVVHAEVRLSSKKKKKCSVQWQKEVEGGTNQPTTSRPPHKEP